MDAAGDAQAEAEQAFVVAAIEPFECFTIAAHDGGKTGGIVCSIGAVGRGIRAKPVVR